MRMRIIIEAASSTHAALRNLFCTFCNISVGLAGRCTTFLVRRVGGGCCCCYCCWSYWRAKWVNYSYLDMFTSCWPVWQSFWLTEHVHWVVSALEGGSWIWHQSQICQLQFLFNHSRTLKKISHEWSSMYGPSYVPFWRWQRACTCGIKNVLFFQFLWIVCLDEKWVFGSILQPSQWQQCIFLCFICD